MTELLHVILGAGPVGRTLADALLARGLRVRIVNRRGAEVPGGVEVMRGDLSDLSFARRAGGGAGVVYNCLNPPYHHWHDLWPPLQAGAMAAAQVAQARLVVMDNVYMYGRSGGQPLTEDRPFRAHTRKGRLRGELDEALLAAHRDGRLEVVIGRASDFFGPRVHASWMGDQVFGRVVAGKSAQFIGDLDMPHTYSYVPDVAKALAILGADLRAAGQVWHLPAPETVTSQEFLRIVFEEVGRPTDLQVIPRWLLAPLGWFSPTIRELREMVYQFEEPFVLDDSRFRATFGLQPTPLRTAIRATVEWFRQHT
jgi:nucleoside-diphosphate-sugar epimerase